MMASYNPPKTALNESLLKPSQLVSTSLILTALTASMNLPLEGRSLGKKATVAASKQFIQIKGPKKQRIQAINPKFRSEAQPARNELRLQRLRSKFQELVTGSKLLPHLKKDDKVSFNAKLATPMNAMSQLSNGAWIYDAIYDSVGNKKNLDPGLFAKDILQYNSQANKDRKITQIYTHGGSMEMSCLGSSGTIESEPCNRSNMKVSYDPGQLSTNSYFAQLENSETSISIMPIVDGRLDDVGEKDVLNAFNSLDRASANIFADKVSSLYCADNKIAGVQFNIEPFDIAQRGQKYFYERIAYNFAVQRNSSFSPIDPFNCVNEMYPHGKIFSVFTSAGKVTPTLGKILNQFQNGYVIISLYDLGPNDAGVINTPEKYAEYAEKEVSKIKSTAAKTQVLYQLGLPAGASVHEFESLNGVGTGFTQLEYIKKALSTIATANLSADPHYKGFNLWSLQTQLFWNDWKFTPAKPSEEVLLYLATNTEKDATSVAASSSSSSDNQAIIAASTVVSVAALLSVGAFFAYKKLREARRDDNQPDIELVRAIV